MPAGSTRHIEPLLGTAFAFSRSITIDHRRVGASDLTNFAVLVAGVYPWLRTVANGGGVQDATGQDVAFFSDPQCTQRLDHEIERWNGTMGDVAYWVRLPTVFTAVDTVFYIAYGATGTGPLDNKRGVWDAATRIVQHLGDGTTADVTDSTGNFAAVNNGATATAGKIAGGIAETGAQYEAITSGFDAISGDDTHTIRVWVKSSAFSTQPIIVAYAGAVGDAFLETNATGTQIQWGYRTSPQANFRTVNADISDGQWHLIHAVKTGAGDSGVFYLDGVAKTTASGTLNNTPTEAGKDLGVGRYTAGSPVTWQGSLDEFRVINAVRSADWVLTEFNNESNPATFYYIDLMPSERKGLRALSRRSFPVRRRRGRLDVVPTAAPIIDTSTPWARASQARRLRGLARARVRRAEVPWIDQSLVDEADPFVRQARTVRGLRLRRSRSVETTPPQFNPPYPFAELVQPRRVRGLLVRRGRRAEAPVAQVVVPPAYPSAAGAQPRRMRGIFRGKARYATAPLDQASIPNGIRARRPKLARNKTRFRSEVIAPQQAPVNPDFAPPIVREARVVRGASRRRGRGVEVVPPQGTPVLANFVTDRSRPRRIRGMAYRRRSRIDGPFPVAALGAFTNGYAYRRLVTVDHTLVSGGTDLTDFPVIIDGVHGYLATPPNGGKVTSASGFDIRFETISGTKLDWELEKYVATTGELVGFVRIPTLAANTAGHGDTTFYMYYGNSAVTTAVEQNPTGVWDAHFRGVWHLRENNGTSTVVDSTSNAAVGTATASGAPTATSGMSVAGQIGDGFTFSGATPPSFVDLTDQASLRIPGDITVTAWVKPTNFSTYRGIIGKTDGAGSPKSYDYYLQPANGKQTFYRGGSPISNTGVPAGVWSHIGASVAGTTVSFSLNGNADGTPATGAGPADGGNNARIGSRGDAVTKFLGPMDELRLSDIARSADWIKTEYNSGNSPDGVFYTLGAEEAGGPVASFVAWVIRQTRATRGIPRLRRARVEVVVPQAAPVAPLLPTSVPQPRRLRGLLARRARRAEVVTAQETVVITGRKRTNRANVRRAERSYEVVPQQQSIIDTSTPWVRGRQPRRMRGIPRTRGRRTDVVQSQLNPPLPILVSVQPRRTRGIPRWRGRSSTPIPAQASAFEGEIRFSKVARVKRLGRRQRRTGFDTFGQAAGPTSLVKTWDGLPRASIKTFDGVANASTKTVDGLP